MTSRLSWPWVTRPLPLSGLSPTSDHILNVNAQYSSSLSPLVFSLPEEFHWLSFRQLLPHADSPKFKAPAFEFQTLSSDRLLDFSMMMSVSVLCPKLNSVSFWNFSLLLFVKSNITRYKAVSILKLFRALIFHMQIVTKYFWFYSLNSYPFLSTSTMSLALALKY